MAIIAIARELASLGEETAQELARITGYKYLDKEFLERRLSGISQEKREKYDEKSPGFWASLSQQRDDYLHYLRTAILEGAAEGNCIIVGRGGYAILKGVPSMLSIKITSPLAVRVERIRKLHGCDNKRALQIIEQSDHDRGGFHKYFFSTVWTDPREYDLTVNTGNTDPAHAAVAIDALRKVLIDKEKEDSGVAKVADLLLGQRIVTEIIYAKKTPIHFLEAAAENGRIVLHGVANTQSAIDTALTAARSIPGVETAESAIQLVHEFTVMP
ncbi:MAG: cytidylate kinase family protein [Rectinema sp.]